MLHTKFHGNLPAGYREEDFDGFYHIGACRLSWSFYQRHVIRFPLPESFHTKFGSGRHSFFWENPF